VAQTSAPPRPKTEIPCPTCGAPAEPGQLICLECGSRIALSYRRPPSWRVPIAIVSVVVLAAAAGIYFGVEAIQDDADQDLAARSAPAEPREEQTGGGAEGGEREQAREPAEEQPAERERSDRERAERERESARAEAPPAGAGGVRAWPRGEDAFTVVILSAQDRPSARAFAQSAGQAGTTAGVLEADDYPSLSASTGFWIVFVGTYPNRARADAAAARLGRRFAGAYPQFVNGSEASG
jgi:septal ring-binding cell division protein DamX